MHSSHTVDRKSPYYQFLPDCTQPYHRVRQKSHVKAILCPMIRDEEGFLSEWIGYYYMHGFSHIMLFDDSSSDNFMEEIRPWINLGFVSVRKNFTFESLNNRELPSMTHYQKKISIKSAVEVECKLQALAWGYELFFSIDLDEYIIPKKPKMTIIDMAVEASKNSSCMKFFYPKLNFPSTPHIAEPVHLLTIEAYQTRNPVPVRMDYYMNTQPKYGYFLNRTGYSENLIKFIAYCCTFHGCNYQDRLKDSNICSNGAAKGYFKHDGRGCRAGYINHYSRSLEKFALKSKTWETAKDGSPGDATAYDVLEFLKRSIGWKYDPTALRYSCQLREVLSSVTGNSTFLRSGHHWIRNVEFGRPIDDPQKRGRFGHPLPEGFTYRDGNRYHYHGEKQKQTHLSGGFIKTG